MFSVYCPGHPEVVLIWTSGKQIVNTPWGIELRYHCTCGYRGVWLTGRRSRGASRPPLACCQW